MAALALLDPSSFEQTLLSRRRGSLDPLSPPENPPTGRADIFDKRPGLRSADRSKSEMEGFDQDSSLEHGQRGEEESVSRVSSSEQKPERPGTRARARRGSMREYSSDSDEEYEGTRRRRERRGLSDPKYKKSLSDFHFERPDPITAAKNKANRERQRRERLNDSFAELVKTLDPEGSVKGEKTSIIAGTIKSINSLRKDNDKLRQEKSDIQQQLSQTEKDKRDVEFQRAMLERQLEDLRLSVYSQRTMSPLGPRAELAGQIDMSHQQQPSPGGLSRMLQEQASLHSNQQQRSLSPIEAQMLQQELRSQQSAQQQQSNQFLPLLGSQPMDQPMQQPGNSSGLNPNFNPNTDYLDMDTMLNADISPDGMSMSPILWLNEALGPEADESYMCSNL